MGQQKLRIRMHPRTRKSEILASAVSLAEQDGGWHTLTRDRVAKHAGVATGLVSHYFAPFSTLQQAVRKKLGE